MKNVTMTSTVNRIKNAYDAKRNLPVGADGQAVLVSATEYALVEIAAWQQSEIAALKAQVKRLEGRVGPVVADGSNLGRSKLFKT